MPFALRKEGVSFAEYDDVVSQTTEERMTLYEAAKAAQKEVQMDLQGVLNMLPPKHLDSNQWKKVIGRIERIQ